MNPGRIDESWESGVGCQVSDVGSSKSEVRSPKSEARSSTICILTFGNEGTMDFVDESWKSVPGSLFVVWFSFLQTHSFRNFQKQYSNYDCTIQNR